MYIPSDYIKTILDTVQSKNIDVNKLNIKPIAKRKQSNLTIYYSYINDKPKWIIEYNKNIYITPVIYNISDINIYKIKNIQIDAESGNIYPDNYIVLSKKQIEKINIDDNECNFFRSDLGNVMIMINKNAFYNTNFFAFKIENIDRKALKIEDITKWKVYFCSSLARYSELRNRIDVIISGKFVASPCFLSNQKPEFGITTKETIDQYPSYMPEHILNYNNHGGYQILHYRLYPDCIPKGKFQNKNCVITVRMNNASVRIKGRCLVEDMGRVVTMMFRGKSSIKVLPEIEKSMFELKHFDCACNQNDENLLGVWFANPFTKRIEMEYQEI